MAGLMNPVKLTGKAKLTPEVEAELGAYRMDSGFLCQPAEHIYSTMVRAATGFQIQGRGKTTYKDSVKGSLLVLPDPIIPLLTSTGEPIKDYEIDARPVRIGTARVMRHRPLLRNWRLDFALRILEEETLPPEVANAILVKAGQTKGIGDYRPRYGCFTVTRWEVEG